jgi:hypothetical protein
VQRRSAVHLLLAASDDGCRPTIGLIITSARPGATAPTTLLPARLDWRQASDDVHVATLDGEYAGHVASDGDGFAAFGPTGSGLGVHRTLGAAKSKLEPAPPARPRSRPRRGRGRARRATLIGFDAGL